MKGSTTRQREGYPPARSTTRGAGRSSAQKPGARGETWEWIKSIAIAFALFLVIRTFLVQAFTIPSGSMENTLLIGDYLMANNAIYGAHLPLSNLRMPAFRDPEHGEIVVFRPAYNDPIIDVVKRVIGEPGDTVEMRERVVYRNGQPLNEPYTDPDYLPDVPMDTYGFGGFAWHWDHLPAGVDREGYRPTRDNWGPLIVPERQYLLLGDNRDQSLDSRYVGFIPREVIRGKAMFIYYSIDPFTDRPFPRAVTAARWGRIGQAIR